MRSRSEFSMRGYLAGQAGHFFGLQLQESPQVQRGFFSVAAANRVKVRASKRADRTQNGLKVFILTLGGFGLGWEAKEEGDGH